MSYFKQVDGQIALTPTGQYVLGYLGLTLDALKQMSKIQLITHVKKFSDALNDGVVTESRQGKPRTASIHNLTRLNNSSQGTQVNCEYSDVGSFSRYFDLDKWFEKQLEKLPESARRTFPFLIVPKASKSERNQGLDALDGKPLFGEYQDGSKMGWTNADSPNRTGHMNIRKNFHPTVKPLKLMSYLVTLGSREDDVVLDPFAGSGTTCIAAHILNRKWIGIEINQEYANIANERLKPYLSQTVLFGDK